MKGIAKVCFNILLIVVLITVFTACKNSKDEEKRKNSVSKDMSASTSSKVQSENTGSGSASTSSKVQSENTGSGSASTSSKTQSEDTESEEAKIRMVRVDNVVYRETGYVLSTLKCGVEDGKILTSNDEYPEKNDESNFGTGYSYQKNGPVHLYVKIDGKWQVFMPIAISSIVLPEGVAHFEAEIIEGDKENILVKITDLPKEFAYIFGNKKAEEIKPVQIVLKDLPINNGIKKIRNVDLPGKRIEVWFDGEIKGDGVSNPIEVKKVYDLLVSTEK